MTDPTDPRDPLFADMAAQMRPDETVVRALDAQLVAEQSTVVTLQPGTHPAGPRSRWSRPTVWIAAAAALVLAVGIGGGVLLSRDGGSPVVGPSGSVPADYHAVYVAVAQAAGVGPTPAPVPTRPGGADPTFNAPPPDASWDDRPVPDDVDMAEEAEPSAKEPSADGAPAQRSPSSDDDHTSTNVQVANIDEADIVKTDGKRLYVVTGTHVSVVELAGPKTRKLAQVDVATADRWLSVVDLLLDDTTLVVIGETPSGASTKRSGSDRSVDTVVQLYDITKPSAPSLRSTVRQSGEYRTARLWQGKVYLVSDFTVYGYEIDEDDPTTFVPLVSDRKGTKLVAPSDVTLMPDPADARYAVATALDVRTGAHTGQQAVLGGADTVYMSAQNLYMGGTSTSRSGGSTTLVRLALADGQMSVAAYGEVPGKLLNQFALDEHGDDLRVVTTARDHRGTTSNLYVLSADLRLVGSVSDMAPGEQVKSVRFAGDVGYVVTFRQTDPLFAINLSDPAHPQVMSELKIPGFSAYLHPWDDGHLVGLGMAGTNAGLSGGFKLSLFDVSNPYDVTQTHELAVPGDHCPAMDDHHAVFVDTKNDLIGFSVQAPDGLHYLVYQVNPAYGFTVQHDLLLMPRGWESGPVRAVRAGDYLYVSWGASASGTVGAFELTTGTMVAQTAI
ncbi:MAG: beta-propeller domain-containing protein [Micrococcales bacterium]|nr:beta-propeller domain-containing protein [Micrococcales bacterium]MCL2667654.1 beta-propeller domain-containing protein [Micrococcales bacterium]